MTQRAMSLMDVLAPPGNDWLKELSRRRSELPKGVHIVRFGEGDEDPTLEEDQGSSSKQRQTATAA